MMVLTAAVNCRNILIGLSANEKLEGLELSLSSNAFGVSGCQVMETLVADIRCLASLDISDNGLSFCILSILIHFISFLY